MQCYILILSALTSRLYVFCWMLVFNLDCEWITSEHGGSVDKVFLFHTKCLEFKSQPGQHVVSLSMTCYLNLFESSHLDNF